VPDLPPAASHLPSDLERQLGATGLGFIFDALDEGVTVRDPDDRILYANRTALRWMGVATLEELRSRTTGSILRERAADDERGHPLGSEDLPSVRLLSGGAAEPLLVRTREHGEGPERWHRLRSTPLRARDGRITAAVTIIEDVTGEVAAERRSRFLAQAATTLLSSIDLEETLEHATRLVVPTLGDWCVIDLVQSDGRRRRVATAHRDPERLALMRELERAHPIGMPVGSLAEQAIREGRPVLGAEQPQTVSASAEDAQLMQRIGARSVIACPLRARGRVLGVMLIGRAGEPSADERDEIAVAQSLAAAVGAAVDNARLSTERREASATLQRSLRPSRLPQVPGWTLAATYLPGGAGEETQVGGDFFDVFHAGGEWLAVLGDVTGKGVAAAALTALVRHGSRFVARHEPDPVTILGELDGALRVQEQLSLCTAICASLGSRRATLAVAGHPPPLVVRDDGRLRELGQGGPILGAWPDSRWTQRTVPIAPDETLLLYTDGVTELPGRGGRFGAERLRRWLRDHASEQPAELLAALESELTSFASGAPRDDVAVLALRPGEERS
jgi:serine phosphatase RsbU (regulator of sigma subunit)